MNKSYFPVYQLNWTASRQVDNQKNINQNCQKVLSSGSFEQGVLSDAKGKYAQFINKNTGEFYDWFSGKQSLIEETIRQIDASEGAKIYLF